MTSLFRVAQKVQWFECASQREPEFGYLIVDARWHAGQKRAAHQSIRFQPFERQRVHPL